MKLVVTLTFLMLALPIQSIAEVRERQIGKAVERHISPDEQLKLWVHNQEIIDEDTSDILASVEVDRTDATIVKLKGVVPPIHFASGQADIPQSTVRNLRTVLKSLSNRHNVRLHLVGHADTQPLSAKLAARYGDNAGLSQARAGEVAVFFQDALQVEAESVSYEWAGDTQPIADNLTAAGRTQNRRVEVEVWYDELEDGTVNEQVVIVNEVKRVKVCRIDTVCKLRYVQGHDKRARVQNLIAPLQYDPSGVKVSAAFIEKIRRSMANLSDRANVVIRFLGHTDAQPLAAKAQQIYGNHTALAKARAWRVALAVQEALHLPSGSVDATGFGFEQPLASEATLAGRATNRRVAVEFWYDDPLQELPDEPQLCPIAPEDQRVTQIYRPSWGELPKLDVGQGGITLPQELSPRINRALKDVADRDAPRVRFVGYTSNAHLDRRTARIYGDDIGLATARAKRAMHSVQTAMGLRDDQVEYEGRGYVHADDVINTGFVQGQDSYVAVQVVYDTLAHDESLDGVAIQPLKRELDVANPFALNLMRITVDGEPVDDPGRSSADIQRCTDVALQDTDIRFTFDNLNVQRRLSVDAYPNRLIGDEPVVKFQTHTNYHHFIRRSEIRILPENGSTRTKPLYTLPVDTNGSALWQPDIEQLPRNAETVQYLVRSYSEDGGFDESQPQTFWLTPVNETSEHIADVVDTAPELLASYGDTELAVQNIRLSSGTVRVQGSGIPEEHTVWVAGHQVPVDNNGAFITEQILPEGAHTVEVAVLNKKGNGELFLRDMTLESNDWFYVGMADLTVADTNNSGAASELQINGRLDEEITGRLAFYADGKFGNKWHLTTSVDTQEGALDELFKNFVDKSPDALFRRMDPEDHYPTFGDDSRVTEHTPTSGKLYLKVGRRDTQALWGNFNIGYNQNELARVDRGLYGLNLHHASEQTTTFGERRFAVDGFGAEPGTIPARQEFRGTGGSLYFLHHQDLLIGSERAYIEMRSPTSGLVTRNIALQPSVDYEVDYLQGTVMLAEPLASTVSDDLLVRSGSVSGEHAYLVVRYEYTPGFTEIDAVATGGQGHYWITDYLKVGLTGSFNELDGQDSNLQAAHVVLRKSANSWIKLQQAEVDNPFSDTLTSIDGGFDFESPINTPTDDSPRAYRADVSVGIDDFFDGIEGQLTLYTQQTDAGYQSPGLISARTTDYSGGSLKVPLGDRVSVVAQSDRLDQDEGLSNARYELNIAVNLNDQWRVSTGVRSDIREDDSASVALTQDVGERVDAVLQLGYNPGEKWQIYGYLQDTVENTDAREDNGRVGLGGAYQWSQTMSLDAEVSDGDQGMGGRFGSTYKVSDQTSVYLNYALENERTDNVWRTRSGRQGSLVAGAKMRLSDSTSVYMEERYRHSSALGGYTHASGVSYRPTQHWNLGLSTDMGTLENLETGAETDRNAVGMRLSYTLNKLFTSAAVEYRQDDAEQPDLSVENRETWLFRSSFKLQSSEALRWLGQFNNATSESSLGQFYEGGFTEATLGVAFRPVANDRLNAIAKYTYFFNIPTTGQITLKNTAAEFIQKSHVGSVDLNYDLTERWSVGGKYAYRQGEISIDRNDYTWFDNRAHLYVLRTDYELFENWEVLVEARQLTMPDFGETRTGGLVTISRYFGNRLRLGVGYNFTDFSDDLTDLDFDHRGAFLNITGVL